MEKHWGLGQSPWRQSRIGYWCTCNPVSAGYPSILNMPVPWEDYQGQQQLRSGAWLSSGTSYMDCGWQSWTSDSIKHFGACKILTPISLTLVFTLVFWFYFDMIMTRPWLFPLGIRMYLNYFDFVRACSWSEDFGIVEWVWCFKRLRYFKDWTFKIF